MSQRCARRGSSRTLVRYSVRDVLSAELLSCLGGFPRPSVGDRPLEQQPFDLIALIGARPFDAEPLPTRVLVEAIDAEEPPVALRCELRTATGRALHDPAAIVHERLEDRCVGHRLRDERILVAPMPVLVD